MEKLLKCFLLSIIFDVSAFMSHIEWYRIIWFRGPYIHIYTHIFTLHIWFQNKLTWLAMHDVITNSKITSLKWRPMNKGTLPFVWNNIFDWQYTAFLHYDRQSGPSSEKWHHHASKPHRHLVPFTKTKKQPCFLRCFGQAMLMNCKVNSHQIMPPTETKQECQWRIIK